MSVVKVALVAVLAIVVLKLVLSKFAPGLVAYL